MITLAQEKAMLIREMKRVQRIVDRRKKNDALGKLEDAYRSLACRLEEVNKKILSENKKNPDDKD